MKNTEIIDFDPSNGHNSVSVVTSDWPGSRFGNDEHFLTR